MVLFHASFPRVWLEWNVAGGTLQMLYLENTVKGGLILRTQQAEGLQISTEDKTGAKKCFLWSVRGLFSGSHVCHHFVYVVEVSLALGFSVSGQRSGVPARSSKTKRCMHTYWWEIVSYFWLKGVVPLLPEWRLFWASRPCSWRAVKWFCAGGSALYLLCFCPVCLSALSFWFLIFFPFSQPQYIP